MEVENNSVFELFWYDYGWFYGGISTWLFSEYPIVI